MVRRGADSFVVFGELEHGGRKVGMGIEGSAVGTRVQIAGSEPSSRAELALNLPVQIIDPEVHRLIEEGPNQRRRFLDWGAFHVKQTFVAHWQRYNQVLKQRNAALRSRAGRDAVVAWDVELLQYGDLITDARHEYVLRIQEVAAQIAHRLVGGDLTLAYKAGWSKDCTFAEVLARNLASDMDAGVTQAGPHRGELSIQFDGVTARDHVSRGQQKLLAAGLLIAQLRLFPSTAVVQPTLLLDDPAAELDAVHLAALINELSAHPVQLVVTTLQPTFAAFGEPGKHFALQDGVFQCV